MGRHLIRYIILCSMVCTAGSYPAASNNLMAVRVSSGSDNDFNASEVKAKIEALAGQNLKNSLQLLADSLITLLRADDPDLLKKSDINYYAGISYLLADRYYNSIRHLGQAASLREELELKDVVYARSVYNLGVAHYISGNFDRTREIMLRFIPIGSEIFGPKSNDVAVAYIGLVSSSISTNNFTEFRDYSFKILDILNSNPAALTGNELGDLYNNMGVGYFRVRDYVKARLYLEQAEKIYEETGAAKGGNYISLVNNLAGIFGVLKLNEKENEYYQKGIDLALNDNSDHSNNLLNNYAILLAEAGDVEKGRVVLEEVQARARKVFGIESRFYNKALFNYSDYLLNQVKDPLTALSNFEICTTYSDNNLDDATFRHNLLTSHSKALLEGGRPDLALKKNNEIFFKGIRNVPVQNPDSPVLDSLVASRSTIDALEIRYNIIRALYREEGNKDLLPVIAETSELVARLIDRLRLNISEEESRLMLGANFREKYLRTINDYNNCYQATGEEKYLMKAFEFSERSKVAGLLAATRELRASQFHIPQEVSEFERSLQNNIAFHNFLITGETGKEKPDSGKIKMLTAALLDLISQRDSLVLTFEREYPGYHSLKYSSEVIPLKKVSRITGRRTNYLSYIVSDSALFIFIANRKYHDVIKRPINSSFFDKLAEFSSVLTNPTGNGNARTDFNKYQEAGIYLYNELIKPVREYLVSDQLLISPDNMLSYLPFESLVTSAYEGSDILYRELDYLMNEYDISYTYSATFMEELVNRESKADNNLIAFAPTYYKPLNIDTLLLERGHQASQSFDLPNARIEAEKVAGMTDGKLFLGDDARESVFKSEAGNYGIIHLAMHAFLDDLLPMNSAMLFTDIDDGTEDGLLRTYEVYGLPLRADMIVLSSCNSGSGRLSNGEGILSLARGFLFSGSNSVVMSMWEIEDRSGTEIVSRFYENLMKGMNKSQALKRARLDYLARANQLRSHPYFWSTLVIYGSDDVVFCGVHTFKKYILIILIALILGSAAYLLKRRYS